MACGEFFSIEAVIEGISGDEDMGGFGKQLRNKRKGNMKETNSE